MEFSAFVYFIHAPIVNLPPENSPAIPPTTTPVTKGLNPVPAVRDTKLKHKNGVKLVRTILQLTFILHISRLKAYLSNNEVTRLRD